MLSSPTHLMADALITDICNCTTLIELVDMRNLKSVTRDRIAFRPVPSEDLKKRRNARATAVSGLVGINTLFGSFGSLQPNSIFLSHCSSTSFQPPASQHYFSLTPLQPPAPAPAQRTECKSPGTHSVCRPLHNTRHYGLYLDQKQMEK